MKKKELKTIISLLLEKLDSANVSALAIEDAANQFKDLYQQFYDLSLRENRENDQLKADVFQLRNALSDLKEVLQNVPDGKLYCEVIEEALDVIAKVQL